MPLPDVDALEFASERKWKDTDGPSILRVHNTDSAISVIGYRGNSADVTHNEAYLAN